MDRARGIGDHAHADVVEGGAEVAVAGALVQRRAQAVCEDAGRGLEQRAVAAAGFPTPFVRASGAPEAGLGRAFMVMDRAAGRPVMSGLDGALTPAAIRRLLRQIPGLLAGPMARLHALDPDLVRSELARVPEVSVTVADRICRLATFAAEFGRADLVQAARWLSDHPPAPAPEVICHGDLHPFNLLLDGDRVTVLDWSTALLAPRAYDLASPYCCSASRRCACRAGSGR